MDPYKEIEEEEERAEREAAEQAKEKEERGQWFSGTGDHGLVARKSGIGKYLVWCCVWMLQRPSADLVTCITDAFGHAMGDRIYHGGHRKIPGR